LQQVDRANTTGLQPVVFVHGLWLLPSQVAGHFDEIIRELKIKPPIIGHSFGGLLAQILAGRGLASVTVARGRLRHMFEYSVLPWL
jgi:non-heme chloroperoxidase